MQLIARSTNRAFFAALMFVAAYFTTVTVNAQTAAFQSSAPGGVTTVTQGDTIRLGANEDTVITGTITGMGDGYLIVKAAGKDMRVGLSRVGVKSSTGDMFDVGMQVTATGRLSGNDFGTPILSARTVTVTPQDPYAHLVQ